MALDLITDGESRPYYIKLILKEFEVPIISNIFFNNKKGLILDSELVTFDNSSWVCNPRQFCTDIYEIQEVYLIILLLNNIQSFFDFVPDKFVNRQIKTPSYDAIKRLLDLR